MDGVHRTAVVTSFTLTSAAVGISGEPTQPARSSFCFSAPFNTLSPAPPPDDDDGDDEDDDEGGAAGCLCCHHGSLPVRCRREDLDWYWLNKGEEEEGEAGEDGHPRPRATARPCCPCLVLPPGCQGCTEFRQKGTTDEKMKPRGQQLGPTS